MALPQFTIVPAQLHHAAALAAIYAHHVLHGTATFETTPPSEAEMAERLSKLRDAGAPWLLANGPDDEVLGYAYASQFRDRPAYRYVCENSIYIRDDLRGAGIGRALLTASLLGFREAGVSAVQLEVCARNTHAVRLYHEVGFQVRKTLYRETREEYSEYAI